MTQEAGIRVLPPHVVNQIAAGEVVERPASVLKEVLENAIDAGATQVDVEIAAGGRKLVAVRDNGCGMSRDDALLSIERHATSKIRGVDDIEHISTLGFRGEALAAIASVSRFRMATCARGEVAGTELLVVGGKIQDVRELGCPPGCSVEVRDLFFNVPARRKFLRSHETELGHVRDGFVVQALAHPAVGMRLVTDGRDSFNLAAGATFADRLRDLFGAEYPKKLRPVESDLHGIAVRGYASLPAMHRADRSEQFVFVNGRATSAPVVSYAIREAYRTLMPADRHPSVFLFLEIAPEMVDVNVHPTKREVRFRDGSAVRDAILEGIRHALATDGAGAVAAPAAWTAPGAATAPAAPAVLMHIENLPPTRAFMYPRLPVIPLPAAADGAPPAEPLPASPGEAAPPAPAPWSWCRVLGQIGGLYVILETEDGYVLMDPHAAHERVLFEKFMADVLQNHAHSQALLLPQTVALNVRDALRVRKNLDLMRHMGFGISEFGGDSFVVDALPPYFAAASVETLLVEVAQSLEAAGARGGAERWREQAIATAACKAAVKAQDHLRLEEIEQLVIDLARTQMPYTCPHGRPTLIFTSFRELNRKFGRE